jgi:aspartate racemase
MLAEVAQVVADKGFTRVGLLAKDATVHSDLFQKELLKRGILTITPTADNQARLSSVMFCLERGQPHDGNGFEAVAESLYTQGAEGIILGCTELSLISRGEAQGFIDAVSILTDSVYKK